MYHGRYLALHNIRMIPSVAVNLYGIQSELGLLDLPDLGVPFVELVRGVGVVLG